MRSTHSPRINSSRLDDKYPITIQQYALYGGGALLDWPLQASRRPNLQVFGCVTYLFFSQLTSVAAALVCEHFQFVD